MENIRVNKNEQKIKLDLKLLENFIWLSFRFSQGNPTEQLTLLNYVFSNFYEVSNKEDVSKLKKNLEDRFGFTVKGNSHEKVTTGEVQNEINNIVGILESGVRNEDTYEEVVRSFLFNIITTDAYYLNTMTEGRPGKKLENDGKNGMSDRFNSQFVDFVLRKGGTGDVFFDKVFNDIRKSVFIKFYESLPESDPKKGKFTKESFKFMLANYNKRHPETMVSEAELSKLMGADPQTGQ